jgi:parallel beta-helix repeat protein
MENRRVFESRANFIAFVAETFLLALFLILTFVVPGPAEAATVTLSPGANIQHAISSYPGGTTFILNPGVYRMQSLTPKAGDTFTGQPGADLNGSKVLTNWAQSGHYWVSSGAPALSTPFGDPSLYCQSPTSGCAYQQDLYLNSKPLTHQLALPIVSGQWYFDYTHDVVYMADNPTGQVVELGVSRNAFGGSANNITIQGLTIEKYATTLQAGAIMPYGSGWTVQNNNLRLNHGLGVKTKGSNERILSNTLSMNGQAGIGTSGGTGSLFQNNMIAHNNYAKMAYMSDTGGSKFSLAVNLQVLNNKFLNNDGVGLWCDSESSEVTFSGNTSSGNTLDGIRFEHCTYGTISNNTVTNNGQNPKTGACSLKGHEIVTLDSAHVSISGNTITSNCSGIQINHSTTRKTDPIVPVDVIATDNTIKYNGLTAMLNPIGGKDTDPSGPEYNPANNNYFDYNTYHFVNTTVRGLKNWIWDGIQLADYKTWSQWRAAGQDIHSTINVP